MCGRTRALIDSVARSATIIGNGHDQYRPVLEQIGDSRIVLLGEASHGTHEFYRARAEITQYLIREKGFTAVAVEADWPDALRVNQYVRGYPVGTARNSGLDGFRRFPGWMWRNEETLDFVDWLRKYNDSIAPASSRTKVGFYGLDLYATEAAVQPERHPFFAEQNARLLKNATKYFDAVCRGLPLSWNLRENHMAETLDALIGYLDSPQGVEERGGPVKIVIWEHNSHVGDARATQMGSSGELSLGQLARERYPDETALIGFTTYQGSVFAASGWGGPAEEKVVRPAHPNSYEALFHETRIPRFMINTRHENLEGLIELRLERAIGAVYLPEAELENHYFYAALPLQFDVVVHFDETQALMPLDGRSSMRKRSA